MRKILLLMHKWAYSKYLTQTKIDFNTRLLQFIYRTAVVIFNIYLQCTHILNYKIEKLNHDGNLIVSLTSFPERIKGVWIGIDSIFRQKYRPNRVILTLSKEQFSNGLSDLPYKLLKYIKYGLEIQFEDDNIMPHKKYLYTMLRNRDAIVITVDDDLYYRDDMIERLVKMHNKFPHCVCANKVNCITFNKDKTIKPYLKWVGKPKPNSPQHDYLGVGFAGILYPVKMFKDDRMFCIDDIKECALRADDLWLKAFELLNNIPVVTGDYYCSSISILGDQTVSLRTTNCNRENNQNDVQWKAINEMYNVDDIILNN